MSVSKKRNTARRIVDAAMTVVLLFLMAYQVTGEVAHEWIGVSMTILVIVHQILNRKWYGALFKGKYNPYRILTTVLSILLVLCFAMTAFFRVPFAFLDYDKAGWLVIIENLLMLSTWVLIGTRAAQLCRVLGRKGGSKENPLVPVVCIMAAVIIGMLFVLAGLSAGGSA